ncbi:hypothetical protein G6L90_06645 [Agrobacterium tumefaciens]|uniref:hypothetical protein n=1 Tax=Agrobacterium tumefaciens TaxID=358 RepID=UPI001571C155|nr:hypothetical protein [Agrobacterium tumefaciens]WHO22634.1 hypothetical protein G6L90_06645 [Agrobacterium tumefaciens]
MDISSVVFMGFLAASGLMWALSRHAQKAIPSLDWSSTRNQGDQVAQSKLEASVKTATAKSEKIERLSLYVYSLTFIAFIAYVWMNYTTVINAAKYVLSLLPERPEF